MPDDQAALDAYLEALPDQIREHLSDVVREQAQMLSDAQRAALQSLEQSPDETGNLEGSCTVVPGKNDLEWIVQAGGDLTTGDVRDGSGVPYDYAEAFVYGTSRQPARDFFWTEYRARKPEIQQAINSAIEEVLK